MFLEANLTTDKIAEITIDDGGRLCVKPTTETFPFIWRETMEVHWDPQGGFLYSPKQREWSYVDWFRQILNAVKDQGCSLEVTDTTVWTNIPAPLMDEMRSVR